MNNLPVLQLSFCALKCNLQLTCVNKNAIIMCNKKCIREILAKGFSNHQIMEDGEMEFRYAREW